jgi:hypothetical protein
MKPVPKKYPGIKVQNIKVDTSDFDYKEFMKLFLHKPQQREIIREVIKDKIEIDEFTVEKKGMIIIREKEIKQKNMCSILTLPVTGNSYFMNNRKVFLKQVKDMVSEYKPNKDISCDSLKESFSLLPHQKLVSTYISPDTPYRGLLLYHGLGSGKTCSSIAIAEVMKPYKNIVVMTPKSLEMNYLQQLTKCGDKLYNLHQSWRWVEKPTDAQLEERCLIHKDLLLRQSRRGIWINEGDPYESLSMSDQELIKKQIDIMIHKKYKFIIYNGITSKNIKSHTAQGNPFSNQVVIIDEAHNFVSRILNQLKKKQKEDIIHPSIQLYNLLMDAENCKIIMLSGTPMINDPTEIAVMFNIIRGHMSVWSCKGAITEKDVKENFPDADVVHRSIDTIMVTQSPTGFIRASSTDVTNVNHDSSTFDDRITTFFNKKGGSHIKHEKFKALPDYFEDFNFHFINKESNQLKNKIMFMSRIAGLTSYFPDLVQLMPRLLPIVRHEVPMSVTQFAEYTTARLKEKKTEKKSQDKASGSYRIQTRLLCNTTYPVSARKKRPMNMKAEILNEEEDEDEEPELRGVDEFFSEIDRTDDYTKNIEEYSPKYNAIMNEIQKKKGLQLLYSQFLNIEGIKLFSRVLESRGYTEFKISLNENGWKLDTTDLTKPMYIIYGGTKTTVEQKEMFRNIFNKNWEAVPELLREKVKKLKIPLFMITSAGAEGISLMHVQYVHLMEPYWNPVRIDQVIGRARRICSHNTLPEKDRFVEVHLYLSVYPKNVALDEGLKNDLMNNGLPGTTDEYLDEKAERKRDLSTDVMDCIRRSSIDCSLYGSGCLSQQTDNDESMLFWPDIKNDITTDADVELAGVGVKKDAKVLKSSDGKAIITFKLSELVDGFMPMYSIRTKTQIGFINSSNRLFDINKKPIKLSDAEKLV